MKYMKADLIGPTKLKFSYEGELRNVYHTLLKILDASFQTELFLSVLILLERVK
jgi:hypothetical protein